MDVDIAVKWSEDALAKFDGTFRWASALAVASFLTARGTSAFIRILEIDFDRTTAGLLLFGLLSGTFLQIGRLLTTLVHIARRGDDVSGKVTSTMRLNASLGNPLSETLPHPSLLLDTIGVIVTTAVWFVGALAGLSLLRGGDAQTLGFAMFSLYVAVGIWVGIRVGQAVVIVSSTARLRNARVIVGIAALVVGFVTFFKNANLMMLAR